MQPTIYICAEHLTDNSSEDVQDVLIALRDGLRSRGHSVEIGDGPQWPCLPNWRDQLHFERDWDEILGTITNGQTI